MQNRSIILTLLPILSIPILFQIGSNPITAQTTCDTDTEVCINMSIRLQGITEQPEDNDDLDFVVTLNGGDLSAEAEQTISMSVNTTGIWTGMARFTGVFDEGNDRASDFIIMIKPPKHLKRKICNDSPSEIQDPDNICTTGDYELVLGENDLDLSSIYFLAGDLPVNDSEQNGVVDSVDMVFLRNNIRNNTASTLSKGDLNLDKIVDAQDHSLAVYTLHKGVNTDEE